MKILIACEESQAVCIAFRNKGHEVYSADIQDCSGGHPEWHIKGDVLPLLKEKWDMIIAHPPCTHLACSGARWFDKKIKDGRQKEGIDFFMEFTKANSNHICIENPVGVINSVWQKPSQIIQPWQFGDSFQKTTCLWLKNLPFLKPTKIVDNGEFKIFDSGRKMPLWYSESYGDSKVRSKTFPGIANAMADQWSNIENYRSGFLDRFICR